MKNINQKLSMLAVCFFCLLVAGYKDEKIDGHIFKLDDGRVFELQHKLGDTYLAHKLDVEKAKKIVELKGN
jgi:hypothetical protein